LWLVLAAGGKPVDVASDDSRSTGVPPAIKVRSATSAALMKK
jgi:hypothetical protein